jgi:hypothetical protein
MPAVRVQLETTLAPAIRPKLDRGIARRLDRLARRAHAFHRFAHHPLCDRYAPEVIALGRRRRVCRGCVFALGGVALGAALGCTALLPLYAAAALAVSATAISTFVSHRTRNNRARLGKLWTRGLPFAALAWAFSAGLSACSITGLALSVSIACVVFLLLHAYRRRGPNRGPCLDCPERTSSVPCSGFRDIVRAERAFMRRSREFVRSHST